MNNIYLFSFLSLILPYFSLAQNTWTQKSNFGGTARTNATGFAIGNGGYIGTGYDGSAKSDFWKYEPSTDVWVQKTEFGGTPRSSAVGFSIEGKGYIGTGRIHPSITFCEPPCVEAVELKSFWEYDTLLNSWSMKADFGGTSRFNATGFVIGTTIFIGTGYDYESDFPSTYFSDIWKWEEETNGWLQVTNFPGSARYDAVSFTINGKTYVGTGYDGTYKKDFWEYDPSTNTWTGKADFGGSARGGAVAFTINGKGYVGTGYDGTYKKDFWEYNPITDTWNQVADFGGTARTGAVGFSIGEKGYIGTGYDGSMKQDFWEYSPNETLSTITDIDGNTYNVVEIGTQCWMQENLKTTRYKDGSAIPTSLDNNAWINTTSGAYAIYDNNSGNDAIYGKLYNWYAVNDSRGLCPHGYHIATDAEWQTLVDYLGGNSVAGGAMKSTSVLWTNPNTGATNSSGFTALPAGYRSWDWGGDFYDISNTCFFWSSSENNEDFAGMRYLNYNSSAAGGTNDQKSQGFSCRCVCDGQPSGNNLNSPQINLSLGSINTGQSIAIMGSEFTENGNVDLSITGPSNYNYTTTLTANGTGNFTLPFATNTTMLPGTYNVLATDNITGLSTVIKVFTLVNTSLSGLYLNVLTPVAGNQFNTGQNITLSFSDLIQTGNLYPMNGPKRLYNYDVEYSIDGGSNWTFYTTVTGEEFPTITINKSVNFTTNTPSTYLLKVTDTYQPANSDVSGQFTVGVVTSNIQVEKKWDYSYANQNNDLLGIAADGTARIFLAVSKIDGNTGPAISSVSVSLSDGVSSTTSKLGKVMAATQVSSYSSEANSVSSLSASNANTISNKYWFWYVAPDDFVRTGQGDVTEGSRIVTANITVNYVGGTNEVLQQQIKIVRPPLMLVHGLGGDPSTWNNFRNNSLGSNVNFTNDPRFIVAKAVKLYPHYSFLVNALELVQSDNFTYPAPYFASFQDLIRDMRSNGYASNKVDYVGHSMGGVLIRSVMDNFYTRYTRTGNHANLDYKNYESGYVNKIITISSPHNSSPLADIVDRYIGDLSFISRTLMEQYYFINPNSMPFHLVQPNYNGGFLGVPTFEATPAVRNLKIDQSNGGINFGTTNIPSHLIAGDVFPGTQTFNNYAIPQSVILSYQNVVDQLDFLDRLLNITLANTQDQQLASDLAEAASLDNIVHRAFKYVEIMANTYNLAVFIPESDLVVSVESQLADYPKTAPNVTVFDNNITHCCFGASVLSQVDVGNELMDMLNTSISSSAFSSISATSNKTVPEFLIGTPPSSLFTSSIDTSMIDLLTPSSGSMVYIDSTLSITVDLKDTTNLIKADVTFQGKSYRLQKLETVTTLNIQVSPFSLDTALIYVEALYKYPDSSRFVFDTTKVFVSTLSTLHEIKVEPEILFLLKQETQFPRYYAIYDEFTTTVQSFSPHINATIADNSIVEFDTLTKGFKGINDGETWATISYEGFTDTIYLVVRREIAPDSGIVTTVNELQMAREEAPLTIMIYPNPTNGRINIKANKADDYAIAIFNNTGQVIMTSKFTGNNHSMNISGLPAGLYILGITDTTSHRQMFRVVKE